VGLTAGPADHILPRTMENIPRVFSFAFPIAIWRRRPYVARGSLESTLVEESIRIFKVNFN
jgi:hypothetical protein